MQITGKPVGITLLAILIGLSLFRIGSLELFMRNALDFGKLPSSNESSQAKGHTLNKTHSERNWNKTTRVVNASSTSHGSIKVFSAETGNEISVASVTIVVQLSGEMANNLAKMATGLCLAARLKEDYKLDAEILLRRQEISKWLSARRSVQMCFPQTRDLNFTAAYTEEFLMRESQLSHWNTSILAKVNSNYEEEINVALDYLAEIVQQSEEHDKKPQRPQITDLSITLPFVYANHFSFLGDYVDRHYDLIRNFFSFDPACCKMKPYADETVFHFRNFLTEMPKMGKGLGFEEIDPEQAATKLLGHLVPGSRVAIISRFENLVGDFVHAFEARNLSVRVVSGQSGEEDFCFLMSAQKEIVGSTTSTYFMWAGLLSNATTVRAYSIDSPARRSVWTANGVFHHWNWTHPSLKHRFAFELYQLGFG